MTEAEVKRRYDYLRRRFFTRRTLVHPGELVPPTAARLRWVFLPESSGDLGCTCFDEDGHPYEIALNVALLRHPMSWERDRVLVHEMTHMRLGPAYECRVRGKDRAPALWLEQQNRLAAMGFRFL